MRPRSFVPFVLLGAVVLVLGGLLAGRLAPSGAPDGPIEPVILTPAGLSQDGTATPPAPSTPTVTPPSPTATPPAPTTRPSPRATTRNPAPKPIKPSPRPVDDDDDDDDGADDRDDDDDDD